MDQKSQEKLDRIVKKELHELTLDDIKFLKARRSYLSVNDEEKFKSVIEETKKEKKSAKTK